jgi:hypothetical protein
VQVLGVVGHYRAGAYHASALAFLAQRHQQAVLQGGFSSAIHPTVKDSIVHYGAHQKSISSDCGDAGPGQVFAEAQQNLFHHGGVRIRGGDPDHL